MNSFLLALGSNLGNRRQYLNEALLKLKVLSSGEFQISSTYETPALLPEKSPANWNKPYLNLALKLETSLNPKELLLRVKKMEEEIGREPSDRWAPRCIDIDLILWNGEDIQSEELSIPHQEFKKRAFVLDPIKDLAPHFKPDFKQSLLELARKHPEHSPAFMAVLNITPDSFSDGGSWSSLEKLENHLSEVENFVSYLDLGAESTRPGAQKISPEEEQERLKPVLQLLNKRYKNQILKPRISVDTRHGKTAAWALEMGAEIINDVSGLSDPAMEEVLKSSSCKYILMHSLSVPARRDLTFSETLSPTQELIDWFNGRLKKLDGLGIHKDRILLDPGIGFGKTATQSLELLKNFRQLWIFDLPLLLGHSRKSFLSLMSNSQAHDRDFESIGASIQLANQGADILRVHNPAAHARAWLTAQHLRSP